MRWLPTPKARCYNSTATKTGPKHITEYSINSNPGKVPSPTESKLIYRKASQVSSVTYNLFAIAKKLDSEVQVRAISGTTEQYAEAKSKLKNALKNYPTMVSLFGSMDYCE